MEADTCPWTRDRSARPAREVTGGLRLYTCPALLPDTPGTVGAELDRVDDPLVWRRLDALVCFDPDHPVDSEFVRVEAEVLVDGSDEVVTAQRHVFTGDHGVLGRVVPGGDWTTPRDDAAAVRRP